MDNSFPILVTYKTIRTALLQMLADPEVRAQLRSVIQEIPPAAPAAPVSMYCTVEEYAKRLNVGRHAIFNWLKVGLPSIKQGKYRRIIVSRADEWLQRTKAERPVRRSKRPAAGLT